jgi:thiamine kinase-like enzyme
MEYVASAPIFGKDRPSHYYQLLGKTLSTMHNGMSFPKRKGIFQYIENDIHRLEKKSFLHEIVARVHAMLPTIQQALTPVLQEVPCHNDLIPNNILYTGSAFKIIDYEFAEQGDPYFDIATLLEFTCVSPQDEMELLTSYFGRPMRAKEKAKLFLMKQLVRICFMARLFSIFPNSEVDATAKEYCEFLKTNPKAVFDRRFSALYLFTLASKSFETTEFQEALQELSTNEALSS